MRRHTNRSGGRALLLLGAAVAVVGVLWVSGAGHAAAAAAGAFLVREDAPLPVADAIVVLGGDARHRAPHGAALFRQGLAPVVLAVGGTDADGQHTQAQKTRRVLLRQGVPEAAILVAGQYEASTLQEAIAAADYARDRSWRQIIVVTSPYHTWRAGEMFEHLMAPLGIAVAISGAPDDPYSPQAWWRSPRQRRQVRNEYLKYALWQITGW